jgi:hypothetical protein
MYLSKENHMCQKQENQAHCFPVRIELVFKEDLLKLRFFKVDIGHLSFQIGLLSSVEEKHISGEKKKSSVRSRSI